MATHTSVCPACQEAVPSGRLSCPLCGLLLASVAGASPRRQTRQPTTAAAEAEAQATVPDRPPVAAGAYVPPSPPSSAPFLLPARAWAGITSASPRPTGGLGMSARPMAIAGAGAGSNGMVATNSRGPLLVKVLTAPPAGMVAAQPADHARAADDATTSTEEDAAGWLEAAAGWLMVIGSAVAILGFLLPWSRTVIGSEGAGTYFDTWGIANPSHVMVVLALAAVLALAIVANPIPTWIRTCAVGLAVGGVLVGLTWPYLFGPLGAGPGVLAILVGGVMLGVAGVLDLVEARHAPTESPV